MSGWKSWAAGEVVLATDFQNYVQDQVVQVYAGTAARSSALGTAVTEGMVSYLSDTNSLQVYDGSAWTSVGGGGTASYATTAGTAVYATNAGTSVYSTNAGTSVYATNSGTAVYATTSGTSVYSTTSGTAVYSETSGTATYATNAGTAVNLSGTIPTSQVTGTTIVLNGTAIPIGGTANVTGGGGTADFSNPMTVLGDLIVGGSAGVAERLGIGSANTYLFSNGTVASWNTLGTASYATTSGTAVYATNAGTSVYATTAGTADYSVLSGTAVNVSGTVSASQVSGTAIFLNGTAVLVGGSATVSGGGDSLPSQTGNAGELLVTNGTAASWSNTVTANSTAVPGLIVKGTEDTNTNLQEWQNTAGTQRARVNGYGAFESLPTNGGFGFLGGPYLSLNGSTGSNNARIIVRARSGQTTNLQEWQDSSAGTVASISVTGAISATVSEPATNSLTAGAVGYVGMPQVALTSGGTTISKAHAGEHIYNTSGGTVTIPANSSVPLEVGTTVVVVNGTAASTIAITSDTLRQAGTTNTGTRTLAAYGVATLLKVASTTWYISGNGVS